MTPRLDPRDLDRRVVPAAARSLRRLLDAGERARFRAGRRLRQAGGATSSFARRADERATSAGPLKLLREVPQLALLVVAAVFLSGTAAAVLLAGSDEEPTAAPAGAGAFQPVVRLGVRPGSDVEQYLVQTRVVLDDVARRLPGARLLAVVHFTGYTPVAQVPTLLEGAEPRRVYLRASAAGPGAEVLALPFDGEAAATVLPALCEATAARKAEDARNFSALAESVQPTGPQEQASREQFAAEASRAAAEATAFGGECTTAFAAVVEGTAQALQEIAGRDGVRGVEAAQAGVELEDVDVEPLLPEISGVVEPTGNER